MTTDPEDQPGGRPGEPARYPVPTGGVPRVPYILPPQDPPRDPPPQPMPAVPFPPAQKITEAPAQPPRSPKVHTHGAVPRELPTAPAADPPPGMENIHADLLAADTADALMAAILQTPRWARFSPSERIALVTLVLTIADACHVDPGTRKPSRWAELAEITARMATKARLGVA